ncbi:MAG: hypothetical protein IT524_07590 [Nitrosomonas sp.]|nr:hypothetical protein [Nitrosomonas sp.]
MNRNIAISMLAVSVFTGCVSTSAVYEKAKNLNYEPEPKAEVLIALMAERIRLNLKDPDSLKNLKISSKYACYASSMGVPDNISPKYEYGYWCYNFSYNATNSYGGYVPGTAFAVYYKGNLYSPAKIGETVRKSDDVWVYHTK